MTRDRFQLVGSVIDGKYRVDAVVGEGGYGVVYRGHHLNFDRAIAVKCLVIPRHFTSDAHALFLSHFRAEGKHLAELSDHRAVTRVYDFGVTSKHVPYLVLEWLEGEDLEQLLARRDSPLSEREALELLRPAIDALGYAHELGIAHRDIKPANLFRARTPRGDVLKVLDFGIAKAMQEGETATQRATKTSSGVSSFTPSYGAPEQFARKKFGPTGPWTDVHALGLVLVELLTGRPPFDGDEMADFLMACIDDERPTPRRRGAEVSDGLEQLCARALAREPQHRFAGGAELLVAVDRLLESSQSAPLVDALAPTERLATSADPAGLPPTPVTVEQAPAVAPPDPARLRSGRRRAPTRLVAGGVALVATIAAVVAGVAKLTNDEQPPAPSTMPSTRPSITPSASSSPTPSMPSSASPPPAAPVGMVLVPAGSFWMGCAPSYSLCEAGEKPRHSVYLNAFYIDKTEVTVSAYKACVSAGSCTAPDPYDASSNCNWRWSGRDSHPINCVDFSQAKAYCSNASKRLPTEAEWEKAARGTDGRIYPWGNQAPSCALTIWGDGSNTDGCGLDSTWPVGSKPAGASFYGALDLAGNVWEWTSDWYDAGYYSKSPSRNPSGPAGGSGRVIRGGSWASGDASDLRASSRDGGRPPALSGLAGPSPGTTTWGFGALAPRVDT